ncbi:MAG: sigma 54-interacting transcriptional regulator [Legionella sp.]|uniref:sigma 54-interacting transcriptional regulator n=1 Tax=Legionella sp. TaxID=459 RepID=UPI00283DDF7A|nr:sigma 54-interacting transcriptional regulator [Legionella sp.]
MQEVARSMFDYGVINLTSREEGIIACSCPDKECFGLFRFPGPTVPLNDFYKNLFSLQNLDDHIYVTKLSYYSSLPLSSEHVKILESFDIPHYSLSSITNYEDELDVYLSENPELETDYYCSLNRIAPEVMGTTMNVWWYRKDDIEKMFKIEQANGSRVFPRYMMHHNLLEDIDRFCWDHHLEKLFFDGLEKNLLSMMTYSWDMGEIAKQYGFLELLTPPRVILGKKDDVFSSNHYKSNTIWKNFHKEFVQEQLLSQSELFIGEYLEQYSQTHFSFQHVEDLISRYRDKIYNGLTSRRKKDAARQETIEELIKQADKDAPAFKHIISKSEEVLRLKLDLSKLVKNNKKPFSILFTGETGTGKTIFAKAIHDASGRRGRFVNENAAAIPTGIFEGALFGHKKGAFSGAVSDSIGFFQSANHGTLFLDEIGEIDISLQVKLLKAIEEGFVLPLGSSVPVGFNVLMLFATNKDLEKAIEEGGFREDLYYRISSISYTIPPLRKRKNDILPLALYFVKKCAEENDREKVAEIRISNDAQDLLQSYKWPGNTRELENIITKIIRHRDLDDLRDISVDEIAPNLRKIKPDANATSNKSGHDDSVSDAPPVVKKATGKRKMPEKAEIEELLRFYTKKKKYGAVSKVAKHIGVDPATLSREIKRLQIFIP